LHTRRLETLCRHVYHRLVTSEEHRLLFADRSIDGFWTGTSETEQRRLWGEPLGSFPGTPWDDLTRVWK
jgi:hypothetical protein